jgi:hypothetical protein
MTLHEFLRWDDGTETRYELFGGLPAAIPLSIEAQRMLAVRLARGSILGCLTAVRAMRSSMPA